MTKSGRRKRKKLSSSSSIEGPSTVQDKEGEVSDSEVPAAMASEESVNETPSLADVWKVRIRRIWRSWYLMWNLQRVKSTFGQRK